MGAMNNVPEYPVGCMIVSEDPYVEQQMGVVLGAFTGKWEYREILWLDGRVTTEGVIYLGTFYRPISFLPDR